LKFQKQSTKWFVISQTGLGTGKFKLEDIVIAIESVIIIVSPFPVIYYNFSFDF